MEAVYCDRRRDGRDIPNILTITPPVTIYSSHYPGIIS
jgi:hypothetical protein